MQDDYRARKDLTLSGGVRQEYKRISADSTSVRAAASCGLRSRMARRPCAPAAASSSTGSTRNTFEQAVQLDGTHQQIATIVEPGYPDLARRTTRSPCHPAACSSRLRDLQPRFARAMFGVERRCLETSG